ncbi:hypothetical protein NL676_039100 [Syzygium grande]|nr:hypothetical protein NL676_039100 [Syzygium grande]
MGASSLPARLDGRQNGWGTGPRGNGFGRRNEYDGAEVAMNDAPRWPGRLAMEQRVESSDGGANDHELGANGS